MNLNVFLCLLPLDLRDEIDDLMKKKSENSDREPDQTHHQPAVPVEPGRLLLQPVSVDLAVGREVLQTLVRVQDLTLLVRVLVVDGRKAQGRLEGHLVAVLFYLITFLKHLWKIRREREFFITV